MHGRPPRLSQDISTFSAPFPIPGQVEGGTCKRLERGTVTGQELHPRHTVVVCFWNDIVEELLPRRNELLSPQTPHRRLRRFCCHRKPKAATQAAHAKQAKTLRQQTIKVGGNARERSYAGLDCPLSSILVAFGASSNPSTSAPGCATRRLSFGSKSARVVRRESPTFSALPPLSPKVAQAILFNERIVNRPGQACLSTPALPIPFLI